MRCFLILAASTFIATPLLAGQAQIEARVLYQSKCLACHTTREVSLQEKGQLAGPPADEVMLHVKEKYPQKEQALAFMLDYIMQPDVDKALCASMDKFGLMPSMQNALTPNEAKAVLGMMFDKFPRDNFVRMETKSRAGVTFATIDSNADGAVTPEEFRNFRAKRNHIDPATFRNDLFFKRVDKNGDGKMSPEEFQSMRKERQR